jgi:hypothetical protein
MVGIFDAACYYGCGCADPEFDMGWVVILKPCGGREVKYVSVGRKHEWPGFIEGVGSGL